MIYAPRGETYAEDRDLLPSRSDARARELYETGYAVRGFYARLTVDCGMFKIVAARRKLLCSVTTNA
jgi:hypothetical protein